MNEIINKLWGYEYVIINNSQYCGKRLLVYPRKKSSVHYHKNKKETFYIINGSLVLEYSNSHSLEQWTALDDITIIVLGVGDSFTIEQNIAHRFYSANDFCCEFIEFSTHHEDNDSYRIIPSQ